MNTGVQDTRPRKTTDDMFHHRHCTLYQPRVMLCQATEHVNQNSEAPYIIIHIALYIVIYL